MSGSWLPSGCGKSTFLNVVAGLVEHAVSLGITTFDLADIYGGIEDERAQHIAWSRPIELRHVEGNLFVMPGSEHVAHNHVWMRAVGEP